MTRPLRLTLHSPLTEVKGVGGTYLEMFNKAGIFTVFDLLLRFPVTYIDLSSPSIKPDSGSERLYWVEVESVRLNRIFHKKLSIIKCSARLGEEILKVTLFNRTYLFDLLKKNKQVFIFGKVEEKGGSYEINNPLVFTQLESAEVLPVYRPISGLKSGRVRKIVENVFAVLDDDFDCLPAFILEKYAFPPIVAALRAIHLPSAGDIQRVETPKKRFIYTEFLLFQLELQAIRHIFRRTRRLHHYTMGTRVQAAIKNCLPFALTADQIAAYEDIVHDLKGDLAMQRLLQGDVGSGKTVIAFLALLIARENNFQGAFLAPTEILVSQHYLNAQNFFKTARLALLTGSTPEKTRKEIQDRLAEGQIDIVFGTHALLHEGVTFKNLSLVIIDEQHRFGVSQRAAIYYKGKNVDLLVTTATPIPRTLLLSMYHDLSVSTIKTKPAGRLPIITRIVDAPKRDEFYRWLKEKIIQGEKTYIILPLVEDSEFFSNLRSLEQEEAYFQEVFPDIGWGMVSGRTPIQVKDALIKDFSSGRLRVLIATTVIEVGIDVGDASRIVIENADRYGLAQLHQLRGRVGRGERQSYCYLIPSEQKTEAGRQRIESIAATDDGFKIAEMDLQMRGGGLITGQEQSGYFDFTIGDVKRDQAIFRAARQDAGRLIGDQASRGAYLDQCLETIKKKAGQLNFS